MKKRLIVNADDLGRTPGVNRGILEAHRRGIVTSATLMVNQPASQEVAGRLIQDHPELGLGLHLALTGGPPAAPRERIPSLLDARGWLPAQVAGLEAARTQEMAIELRAQVRRFRELTRAEPTHLDCHHHAHELPQVLEAVVTLAWETGLPVRSTTPEMRARFRREDIRTPDAFIGDFYGDATGEEDLERVLSSLEPGVTELMCHPAVVDEALRAGSSYVEPRARELTALTSSEMRRLLQATGVELIHYRALVEA